MDSSTAMDWLPASCNASRKSAGVPLIVAVDKVAASGGYMMACVADRIVAAPFAVLSVPSACSRSYPIFIDC
ncbi:MAG: S49 family peptidase [Halioglobus sp.]